MTGLGDRREFLVAFFEKLFSLVFHQFEFLLNQRDMIGFLLFLQVQRALSWRIGNATRSGSHQKKVDPETDILCNANCYILRLIIKLNYFICRMQKLLLLIFQDTPELFHLIYILSKSNMHNINVSGIYFFIGIIDEASKRFVRG